jgi:phosphoribosyl-ATP pyrophosphohydrolase/phosphoribosyl-AMP cyclohydrolase
MNLEQIRFNSDGLVPVIVQDAQSGQVLTLAWANREALAQTIATGESYFYSRSRGELWHKGETSGNRQQIVEILADCDQDALIYRVIPTGPACHTGAQSCFFESLAGENAANLGQILAELERTIASRLNNPLEGSYVAKMHQAGLDRILKKIGEEAGEVIIAAKNPDPAELVWEASDLIFHLLLVLRERGLSLAQIAAELKRRHAPASMDS